MIAEPDAVDANRSEYLGPAWRRHSDLLENRLTTAHARSCCRDGRVSQSSLRLNITTQRPGAVSRRGRGSRHSDVESAEGALPDGRLLGEL
jgi:hypothetical protein